MVDLSEREKRLWGRERGDRANAELSGFWSCNKAVANAFPHKAEPSCATKTGQYLLDYL